MIQSESAEVNGSQTGQSSASRSTVVIDPADSIRPAAVLQATDVLMDSFGVSAVQADELLYACARQCDRSPEAVAEVFVRQVWYGDETPGDRFVARALEQALRNLPQLVALTRRRNA